MERRIGLLLLAFWIGVLFAPRNLASVDGNAGEQLLTGCLVTSEAAFVLMIDLQDSDVESSQSEYRLVPEEHIDLIPSVGQRVQVRGSFEQERYVAAGQERRTIIKVDELKSLSRRCP